jgi:hypothetical protein
MDGLGQENAKAMPSADRFKYLKLLDVFYRGTRAASAFVPTRQILPGRLRSFNHKNPYFAPSRGSSRGLGGALQMRVQATAKSGVAATGASRRTSAGGFTVGNDNAPSPASATTAASALNSIDALLALQGVEDAVERRRRFAKRGVKALDMLDALKLEILEGRMDVATLSRLESMLGELTERSGESRLDDTLDAIGVRVAVELAKRQPRMAQ